MKVYTKKQAEKMGLEALTIWVRDVPKEHEFLLSMQQQVLKGKDRQAVIVQEGGLMSLYVNIIARG